MPQQDLRIECDAVQIARPKWVVEEAGIQVGLNLQKKAVRGLPGTLHTHMAEKTLITLVELETHTFDQNACLEPIVSVGNNASLI